MADKTPDYALSGILVPRKFSTTLAADYATGSDYTEADRKPGGVTFDGSNERLTIEATGDIDATATNKPAIKVTRGGMPGPDGAGFVYRYGTSGDWYGTDPIASLTYYEQIASTSSWYYSLGNGTARVIKLTDETIVAITVRGNSNSRTLESHVRNNTTGAWTTTTIKAATSTVSASGFDSAGACIAPDGSIHVYWPEANDGSLWTLSLYRSVDGSNWYLQNESVKLSTSTVINASTTHIAAETINGSVVLFTGTTSSTQYVSSDGGYTFETIGSANSDAIVMGTASYGGFLHALVADGSGTKTAYHYRIASGSSPIWDATANSLAVCDESASGCIVSTEEGLLCWFLTNASPGKMYGVAYRSTDVGASWLSTSGPQNNEPINIVGCIGGVWSRGRLHIVGTKRSATTGAVPDFETTNHLVSIVLGGHTTIPMYGRDKLELASNRRAWVPMTNLEDSGWAESDTGSPTRALSSESGLRITTTGGVESKNEYSDTASFDTQSDQLVSLKVVSGTALIVTESRPVSMSVYVTSTTISKVETGGTPSYSDHGITGYIEIRISVDGEEEKGRVWYRADNGSPERSWTELGSAISLSTTTYTAAKSIIQVAQLSDVFFMRVMWKNLYQPPTPGFVDMDTTVGVDINPVGILASERVYLGSGIYVRGLGGPGRYDTGTYTVSLGGSRYKKSNLLPQVSPSPRAPWRSAATTTQVLDFTVDVDTGAETEWMSGVVGYYFDGLTNVSQITLKNSGATIGAIDFRTSFVYTCDNGVIYPASTGSTVDGQYVTEGSLIGCQFEFANGQVRDIVDNTGGVLTSGSTVAEKRCRIRVDGLTGAEDTSGTGYIWPKRALVLQYLRGTREVTQVQVEIASSVGADSRAYRQIGTIAIGEVSVFGRAFDRTVSNEYTAGTSIFDAEDGGSVATITGPMQRTMEVAFVESPTFLGQIRSGGSPDYVTTSASGSALPAATEFGVPMTAEGIYRRTDGGFLPVVPIRRIPRDSGSGSALYVSTIGRGAITEGTFLARITGSIRREQIQVGQAMVDDAERVATITFKEIV